MAAYIDHINFMDNLAAIEHKVGENHGFPVLKISHWDSSVEYTNQLNRNLMLPSNQAPWDYTYSYSISGKDRERLMEKLGVPQEQISLSMALILQSSTIAIINLANLIKQFGYKRVCIVQPSYFSVAQCFDSFGIQYDFEYITFHGADTEIPVKRIIEKNYDVVWLTSPIYCTGVYYTKGQMESINDLLDNDLLVICDESLALSGYELVRQIGNRQNFISIHSPHKAISINGLKFSTILCSIVYEDFLEQWVDILSGALSQSNCDAFYHFLSDNFDLCHDTYTIYIENVKRELMNCVQTVSEVDMLPNTHGHYITVFYRNCDSRRGMQIDYLESVISKTFASFYPGQLNGLTKEPRLNYRINLTLEISEVTSAFSRISNYITNS